MRNRSPGIALTCALALLTGTALFAGGPEPLPTHYETREASRDGTGRFYMGREVSRVMGHLAAGWLERPTRQQEERTDLLLQMLEPAPDAIVADLGAGTGYFSFPLARRVTHGRVIAVDIQPEMLALIEARKNDRGTENVRTILGTVTDPGLAPGTVDLILIVDAYHEFSHPREMGEAMAAALRPGGLLVLVEYRGEDPAVPIKPLHKMTEAQARREMQAVGLVWEQTLDTLPQQHILVFAKP